MPAWIDLDLPLDEARVRRLKAGDAVRLRGTVFTARDAVHKFLAGGGAAPCDLRNGVLFHCGPVMVPDPAGGWKVTAAGPTTSIREEPYMAAIVERFGIRGIIGKGGMGAATLDACRRCGCVYLHAVGGTAQVLARHIRAVRNVYLKEQFGAPEAVWELVVEDFPVTVTMDSHGRSLHAEVAAGSQSALRELLDTPR